MELAGSGYLYTLATLAMTFVGFCAIVLVLRQSMGAQSSKFHRYASHVYIELGLTSAAFAMLAPLLAVCGLPPAAVWRLASAMIAIAIAVHTWFILRQFKASRPGPFPARVWVNTTITVLVVLVLLANTAGLLIEPGVGPVAIAATWRLVMGVEVFMLTLEEFLERSVKRK
jgi:hypothetical protein